MRAAFNALRHHATARGIPFSLSFLEFRKFAMHSQYLLKKGNRAGSITVDRINNLRGYVRGNIQPLTRSANAIKQAKIDEIRQRKGYAWQENY